MGCACYDEGYSDGVDDTERDSRIQKSEKNLSWDSVEKLVEILWNDPYIQQKVKDIFDSQGWKLERKNKVR